MSVRVHQARIEVTTAGRGFVDLTAEVGRVVAESGVATGTCHVFLQHTSASLLVQENADPSVRRDLVRFMERIAPEGPGYEHDDEGPDDMPAHIRAAITQTSETLPVVQGALGLGTWQALYLFEHRHRSHRRRLIVTVSGLGGLVG